MHDTHQTLHITSPPDDEQLVYSKHVEVIVKNKTQKVHLVGSITYFITMHGQYNIKQNSTFFLQLPFCKSDLTCIRRPLYEDHVRHFLMINFFHASTCDKIKFQYEHTKPEIINSIYYAVQFVDCRSLQHYAVPFNTLRDGGSTDVEIFLRTRSPFKAN